MSSPSITVPGVVNAGYGGTVSPTAGAITSAGRGSGAASVNTPTLAYNQMQTHWELPRTLMGGTIAMRLAEKKYLPREPKETEISYRHRLLWSCLFPGFKQSVFALAAKPFQKPVILADNAPNALKNLVADVDNNGRDLTQFARDIEADAICDGIAYILVDYPNTNGASMTLADERAQNIRPYFVALTAQDVIEIRTERRAGKEVPIRVRIRETIVEQDGDWGEQAVLRVRVLYPDHFEVYKVVQEKKGAQEVWLMIEAGPNTLGKIPLVPLYTGYKGSFFAEPPLEELAFLNLCHWQSASDQLNILHVARVPILFGAGFPGADQKGQPISVGPSDMVTTPNPQAKLAYVEHGGKAIDSGRQHLEDLKEEMSMMGFEPLIHRATPGDVSATQRALDAAEIGTRMQAWARTEETALEQAFVLAAEWLKIKLGKAQSDVKMDTDFGLSLRDAADLDQLYKARLMKEISHATYLAGLKRHRVLPDDFDTLSDQALLDAEAKKDPALSQLQPDPNAVPIQGNVRNLPTRRGAQAQPWNRTAAPVVEPPGTVKLTAQPKAGAGSK